MIVNVDLDGVLYKFVEHATDILLKAGWKVPNGIRSWDLTEQVIMPDGKHPTKGQLWGLLDESVKTEERLFWNLDYSYPERIKYITELHRRGVHIRLVTSKQRLNDRLEGDLYSMIGWWARHSGLHYDELVFTDADKTAYRATYVLDDNPNVKTWKQDGAINCLVRQPWNEHLELASSWENIEGRLSRYLRMRNHGWTEPTCADKAKDLVMGDRRDAYGHPYYNFKRTGELWSAVLHHPVSPQQVAMCMALLKTAREIYQHSEDNIVDTHGYWLTYEMIREKEEELRLEAISSLTPEGEEGIVTP